MAVVLDTDHLSILQWEEQPACDRLLARLDTIPSDDIGTTIISFHEQVQGWQAYLNRARSGRQVVLAYAKLEAMWLSFLKMNVLSFGNDAQECFEDLRHPCPRVQTMDLRIASIALITQSTLLSRNLRDFQRIPGLSVEDWST